MLQEDSIVALQADSLLESEELLSDSAEAGLFGGNQLFHPELIAKSVGIEGEPVPYSFANDTLIASLLLAVFLLMSFSISRSWSFIVRQMKSFFFVPRRIAEATDTSSEVRYQYVMVAATSVIMALLYNIYRHSCQETVAGSESNIVTVGCLAGVLFVAAIFRLLYYSFVNWVFFSEEQNERWIHLQLFLTTLYGVLLLPVVVLSMLFGLSMHFLLIYVIFATVLVELLSIFRCFVLFFKRSVFPLQIFLYLCTLEMIPTVLLWLSLKEVADKVILII